MVALGILQLLLHGCNQIIDHLGVNALEKAAALDVWLPAGFGPLRINIDESLGDKLRDGYSGVPFPVGWDDIPRRMLG